MKMSLNWIAPGDRVGRWLRDPQHGMPEQDQQCSLPPMWIECIVHYQNVTLVEPNCMKVGTGWRLETISIRSLWMDASTLRIATKLYDPGSVSVNEDERNVTGERVWLNFGSGSTSLQHTVQPMEFRPFGSSPRMRRNTMYHTLFSGQNFVLWYQVRFTNRPEWSNVFFKPLPNILRYHSLLRRVPRRFVHAVSQLGSSVVKIVKISFTL
jgi:hypothetical protein